jgi:hypothetical protein
MKSYARNNRRYLLRNDVKSTRKPTADRYESGNKAPESKIKLLK